MKINCSKWPYTSFLIPAYQKIVIAKKADFHARRTSRSAHDRLANILRTHAVWASGERNAIMARGRLYNRNFGPRATITLRARSLMFYNRLSRSRQPAMYTRNKGKTCWVPAADFLPTESQWDVMQSMYTPCGG